MLQFYQGRSWRNLLRSPLMAIVLFVVIIFLSIAVYNRFLIEREMSNRRAELEMDLIKLEERRQNLSEQVEYLSHERGIEAEMRRNFDVAQPGEKVVIILEDESVEVELIPTTTPASKSKPWYKFWE